VKVARPVLRGPGPSNGLGLPDSSVRRHKGKAQQQRRRVRVGAADASLTGLAGLAAVEELIAGLGMVSALDRGIGPIKARARGLTGGQLLLGIATAQLVGQDCLAGLDRVRADAGSALLTSAPVAASTTAAGLASRFGPAQRAGIETGLRQVYDRWLARLPAAVRAPLVLRDPTIDLDASDIEVYGASKQNVGWNYAGLRCGRVHLASWAQAELPLAADLIAGNDDVRPTSGPTPQICYAGHWQCCRHRCAAARGCAPTPATSTPSWRTPRSTLAATSRSPRSAIRPPGGPSRPSPRTTGATRGT
jgi:hypothetical protein